MTNSKHAKRALLASVLSVVLCCAMLVGSTFAWFTDSVTSGNNIIKSGALEVAMDWADGKTDPAANEDSQWQDVSHSAIFDYALWEPGYTQARHIRIRNTGNLALKYEIRIAPTGTVTDLAKVIDVYYIKDGRQIADRTDLEELEPVGTLDKVLADPVVAKGHLLAEAGQDVDTATIVLKMQEGAGSEYENMSIGDSFTIQLVTTQYTHEDDSFGNDYDADLPLTQVSNINELMNAIENGGAVMMTGNIDAGSEIGSKISIAANTTINGNGNTLSTNDPDTVAYNSRVIDMTGQNDVTLTIADVAIAGGTKAGTSPYLYRGISLYDNMNPVLNIRNSSVKAGHYAINVASNNTDAIINVNNSSLLGYAAFQTHSADTIATFTASTLTGLNQWGREGGNDFATIVVNQSATGSSLTFNNCTIEANEMNDATEYLFSLRSDCTVSLNGCTFMKNGVEISAAELFADLQKTNDEYEDLYNDYVYIYGGTEINVLVDGENVNLAVE